MKPRAIADIPSVRAIYWFARFSEAVESGDSLLADAARDQLRDLGFEVASVRPSRRRRRS